MNTATTRTAQTHPRRDDHADPTPTIGRTPKVAPGRSQGVAYATSDQLASLSGFIASMTAAAKETGWHATNLIASYGDVEDEKIIVGIRWIDAMGGYVAEIR